MTIPEFRPVLIEPGSQISEIKLGPNAFAENATSCAPAPASQRRTRVGKVANYQEPREGWKSESPSILGRIPSQPLNPTLPVLRPRTIASAAVFDRTSGLPFQSRPHQIHSHQNDSQFVRTQYRCEPPQSNRLNPCPLNSRPAVKMSLANPWLFAAANL